MNRTNMGRVTICGRMQNYIVFGALGLVRREVERRYCRHSHEIHEGWRGILLGVEKKLDTIAFLSMYACYYNKQSMRVGTC